MPYEQIGKNEPVCIADEVPFEIPDSWEWVRMSTVMTFYNGRAYKKPELLLQGKYPVLRVGNLFTNNSWYYSDLELEDDKYCDKNDLLYAWSASFGPFIWQGSKCIYHYHIWKINHSRLLLKEYLYYYLMADTVSIKQVGHGVSMLHVTKEGMEQRLIAIPPFAEQCQIVKKIKTLFPLIEQYDFTETKLTSLNESFPDLLKKSILQQAVMGKLIPQDENDEPASVLLERIRAEKQKLIAEGKIKKDKNESVIFRRDNSHYEKRGAEEVCIDDELPFEIPRSWQWCYLRDVAFVTKLAGFEYTKYIAPNLIDNGIPLFKGKNVQNGKLVLNFEGYIPECLSDELSRSQISKKCLLTPYVGTIGNIAIFNGDFKAHLGSNVGKIELVNPVGLTYLSEEYVLNYLRSPAGYQQLTKRKKATAQESISIDAIRNVIIPIPPTNEQNRIINILAELEGKVQAL